jgi:hypothetical protein
MEYKELDGEFPKDVRFEFARRRLLAYSRSASKAWKFGRESLEKFGLWSQTSIFGSFGQNFVFVTGDGCISEVVLKRRGEGAVKNLLYCESEICCIAADSSFRLLAFGTVDNVIRIHDIDNGCLLGELNCQCRISKVFITAGWGFVLAVASGKLLLFSVNGEFIKAHETKRVFVKMFPISLTSKFDFMAFIDSEGNVGVFEVFYPEREIIIARSPKIVGLGYVPRCGLFILISESGMIRFVSHRLTNFVT